MEGGVFNAHAFCLDGLACFIYNRGYGFKSSECEKKSILMSPRCQIWQSPTHSSSARLAGQALVASAERAVTEYIGRQWLVQEAKDVSDLASHPAAILSNGSYAVFAKFSDAPNGYEQFEIEMAGLRLLSERAGVLVPVPIGIIPVNGGSVFLLEAVQAVHRTPHHWRQVGQTLARIHQIKGERFGLETHSYFGALYQDNTLMNDWPTFYAERRLVPGLRVAIDSGNMPADVAAQVEQLIARLPLVCGPNVAPALLHGDAQQNNFISSEKGAYVIDPAVYYGTPEMDLASVDFFQAVPEDLFEGYREVLPIAPGFEERRDLWRVWGYLGCVALAGESYLAKLIRAVRRYL